MAIPESLIRLSELLITGALIGSLYAPSVLGFNIIYKSSRILNFAHGELLMMGAYLGFAAFALTANIILSVVMVMVLSCLMGIAIANFLLRPIIARPVSSKIMVTIGLSTVLFGIAQVIWGISYVPALEIFPPGSMHLEPFIIPVTYIGGMIISTCLLTIIILFYSRMRFGISMRAVANDPMAAYSMGVDVGLVFVMAWILAAILASMSGILISNVYGMVTPGLVEFVLKVFVASLIGGLDSIGGALVGSVIVGIADSFGAYIEPFIASGFKEILSPMIGLVIILVRPYGLFGTERIERL